jgi:hypothetical protein
MLNLRTGLNPCRLDHFRLLEHRLDLGSEALDLFETEGYPDPLLDQHAVEVRIAFWQTLEVLDDLIGRPTHDAAGLDRILDARRLGVGRASG